MDSTDLTFECPRCQQSVTARFYGPCQACAGDLGQRFPRQGRAVESSEYEPKMNVTPNAVATKD